MRDDVRIREIAVRTDLLLHRGEEGQVDINRLVRAVVERAHLGGSGTAAGLHIIIVKDELRRHVGAAVLGEDLGPDVFRADQDLLGEDGELFLLGGRRPAALADNLRAAHAAHLLQHVGGVAAEQEREESDDNEASEAHAAGHFAGGHTTPVIDVGTKSSSVQSHSYVICLQI